MMRCARFERLAALALGAGARIAPRGDGGFQALHRGQRLELQNLRDVASWLVAVNPERQTEIAHAVRRDAKLKKATKAAAQRQAKLAKRAAATGVTP